MGGNMLSISCFIAPMSNASAVAYKWLSIGNTFMGFPGGT